MVVVTEVGRPLATATQAVPPILLKHLARAEQQMFGTKLSATPMSAPRDAADWDTDPDWNFNPAASDMPDQLSALWEALSSGPARSSAPPSPTAGWTGPSTFQRPTGATPACAR